MLSNEATNVEGPTPNSLVNKLKSPRGLIAVFVVLVVVVAAAFFYITQLKKQAKIDELSLAAREAASAGNFDEALDKYNEALLVDKNNPEVLAEAIKTAALEGSKTGTEVQAQTKAQAYLEKARNSQNKDVLVALGYMAEINGRYQEASDLYQKALAKDPKSADTLFRLGHVSEFLGVPQAVYQDLYAKAYDLDPKHPQVLMAFGRITLARGELDSAYAFYANAAVNTEQKVLQAEAWAAASAIKRTQGKFQEAKNLAQTAVAADRGYGPGLVSYGMSLALDGDLVQGAAFMEEAMRANTRSVQPYWSMAIILRSGKYFKEAEDYLTRGLAMIENDNTLVGDAARKQARAEMTYDLAKTYAMAGDSAQALTYLEKSVGMAPVLASYLKNDFENNGFFGGLRENSRFVKLLNLAT